MRSRCNTDEYNELDCSSLMRAVEAFALLTSVKSQQL
jgi:hypothetical protein